MPRLDDFTGFFTRALAFNPFSDVVAAAPKPPPRSILASLEADEAKADEAKADVKEEGTNPLNDDFPDKSGSPFFREVKPAHSGQRPTPPKMALAMKHVPMDQPRGKDGQRLLYTYPNIPIVRDGDKEYSLLVGSSDKSASAYLMQFDGAANPNPGPASSGAVLWSPKDASGHRSPIVDMGKFLGKATNNVAEIQGLLLGLKIAAMRGARDLLIEGDSELIIRQQTREYKVTNKNLKAWWAEIQAAMMDEISFDWIAIRHVRREFNERADSITKEVLSKREGFTRC
jgi:ribonuclease HI